MAFGASSRNSYPIWEQYSGGSSREYLPVAYVIADGYGLSCESKTSHSGRPRPAFAGMQEN
jgi:hypothetical protein